MKVCIILSLAGWSTFCLANGGGYSSGVNIQGNLTSGQIARDKFSPVNLEKIEMQTEELEIDLFADTATVSVRYDFFNPGSKTTILAAFPCVALKSEADEERDPGEKAKFTEFVIAADGKLVTYSVKGGDMPSTEGVGGVVAELGIEIPKWYVFQLDFAPHQHRVLTVSYRAPYAQYEETVSDLAHIYPKSLAYLFSTAAIWAGSIKHGHVVIRSKSVNPDEVKIRGGKPGRFQNSAKDTWTWDFVDFKPSFSDDIVIETSPQIESVPSFYGKGTDKVNGGEYISRGGHWRFRLTDFKVSASSQKGDDYKPDNVNKGSENQEVDPHSCWIAGVTGSGEGEWLELSPGVPVLLDTLQITNGLTASEAQFRANNRVKRFDVSVNGAQAVTLELPDQMDPFDFKLPESETVVRTIRLTIREIYPGTEHQDTCVTEISLFRNLTRAPRIEPPR